MLIKYLRSIFVCAKLALSKINNSVKLSLCQEKSDYFSLFLYNDVDNINMNADKNDFIERLEGVLKDEKLTKTQLAEDLNIRRENLSVWKKNGSLPSSADGVKIAKYLNVNLEWLVTGEGPKYFTKAEVPEEVYYLRKMELDLFKKYEELNADQKNVIKTLIKTLYNETKEKEEDDFKKTKSS